MDRGCGLFTSNQDLIRPSARSRPGEMLACRIGGINNLLFSAVLDSAAWSAINDLKVEAVSTNTARYDGAAAESFVVSTVIFVAVA
jgi:hypothetical protein